MMIGAFDIVFVSSAPIDVIVVLHNEYF